MANLAVRTISHTSIGAGWHLGTAQLALPASEGSYAHGL
jgi:hypothetical protein